MECRCCAKGIEVTENRSEGDLKIVRPFEKNVSVRLTRSASPFFLGGVSSIGRLPMNFTNCLHSAVEKNSYKSRLKLNELHRASSQTSKTIIWSSRRTRHVKSYLVVKFGNWIGADGVGLEPSLDFFFAIHTRLGLMLSYCRSGTL